MKLALELLRDDPAVGQLKSDVPEMERMVRGYLDFARGEGTETPVETDISLLLEDMAAAMRRQGTPLSVAVPSEYVMQVRPNALRRCIGNLIGNTRRHGSHVWLSGIAVAPMGSTSRSPTTDRGYSRRIGTARSARLFGSISHAIHQPEQSAWA